MRRRRDGYEGLWRVFGIAVALDGAWFDTSFGFGRGFAFCSLGISTRLICKFTNRVCYRGFGLGRHKLVSLASSLS